MKLGDWELSTVSGGTFRTDGGSMFGVVPKSLWSRKVPADENNGIPQNTNCLLARRGKHVVLIDTGYGGRLSPRQLQWMSAQPGAPLLDSLSAVGVGPDDVTCLILTHLHYDHAGGGVSDDAAGGLRPTFPNAEVVVQRTEWEIATAELPELSAAYPLDNILPLQPRLRLIDGEQEILDGIRGLPTPGHTQGHQSVVLESRGETAIYLGDLCPSWHHLPTLWCMAYDVDLLETRRRKPQILGQVVDGGWLALSDHDPDQPAARLRRDDRTQFAVDEAVELGSG